MSRLFTKRNTVKTVHILSAVPQIIKSTVLTFITVVRVRQDLGFSLPKSPELSRGYPSKFLPDSVMP